MSLMKHLVVLVVVAILAVLSAGPVLECSRWAITELNGRGREERARQEQIRDTACQAFPSSCPPPIPTWVDAPLLAGGSGTSSTVR